MIVFLCSCNVGWQPSPVLKRFDPIVYLKDLTQLFSIVMQLGQFIVVVYKDQKNKIYITFFFSITWNLFNSLLDYFF